MEALLKRREEILTEHKAQERLDPYWAREAREGRKLSTRPIAFVCDDEVVLFKECVGKLRDGLTEFFTRSGADRDLLEQRLANEPAFAQAVEKARRVLAAEETDELRVPQAWWNALTFAMQEAGHEVVTADGKVAVPVNLLELIRQNVGD